MAELVSREAVERWATSTLGQTQGEQRLADTAKALYAQLEAQAAVIATAKALARATSQEFMTEYSFAEVNQCHRSLVDAVRVLEEAECNG